jgi:N4-gp56 family major capsid protein
MANTTVATAGTYDKGNAVSQWSKGFFKEYIRKERFFRYSGEGENNIFQHVTDLEKKKGDNITVSLVTRLTGAGVTGDNTLVGTEENLGNYADTITIDQLRHAVKVGAHEQRKTEIDILDAGRFMLIKWSMDQLRTLKIDRLACVHLDGVTTYAAATEAEKDTALTANTDRFLFGELKSNYSAADHSASLLNVDDTSDTAKRSIISLLSRMAKQADPHITPISVKEDAEMWVCFMGTNPHRDLKADLDVIHADAAPRSMKDNPIWHEGDLLWNDTVCREIPEMASLGAVGAAAAPIYQLAFCGCQAVFVGWGERTKPIKNGPDGEDYGNLKGTGIKETRGAKKATFNSKFHGMVTGYVASAADA